MRLRTSSCDGPGYQRIRWVRGFRCLDLGGGPLTDPEEPARIRALTIPGSPDASSAWIPS